MTSPSAPAPPRSPIRNPTEAQSDGDGRRIGAGIGLMVLGGWFAAALYFSAGDRSDVVVLAADVGRFERIERTDLIISRISTDAEVVTIPASRIDQIVGRVAATDLSANSILSESQLLDPGQKLLGADEAIVGVLLGPGDGQMNLARGTQVDGRRAGADRRERPADRDRWAGCSTLRPSHSTLGNGRSSWRCRSRRRE